MITTYELSLRDREALRDLANLAGDGYVAGGVLAYSWGYDQTNIDFYRIVKRSGEWVWLREMEGIETEDPPREPGGPWTMTGRVVAGADQPDAKVFRRKLHKRNGKITGCALRSYGWASLWDGHPMSVSHQA